MERGDEEIERAVALDPQDAASLRVRGILRSNAGRRKEAQADLDRAIALDPDDWLSYLYRGGTYMELGQVDKGLADLERTLTASPEDVLPYETLFEIYTSVGEIEKARAVLDRLGKAAAGWSDPKARAGGHRAMSEAYWAAGDGDRALAEAENAVALEPNDWQNAIARARVRRLRGDTGGFEADCTSAAGMKIQEPHGFLHRGTQLAHRCFRSDLALTDLTRAIEFDPSWSAPLAQRASIYEHLNRMEEALVDRTKAVEAQPSAFWVRSNRADTLYAMGRFEEAFADFNEAVRLHPELAPPYAGRGWALLALLRNEEALATFNKAVELSPDQVENRAGAYLKLGRVEDAIADMDKSIEAYAAPASYANRAYFLTYAAGQCERARADLERSEAQIHENARDARMLSTQAAVHLWGFYYACPELYDGPRALELAKRAVLLDPQDRERRAMLGVAFYRAGRYDEARDTLLESLSARFDNPSKLFFLAMASEKLGKRADARRYYDRAVAWVSAHSPSDVENARFRDEAAKVLRLTEERR